MTRRARRAARAPRLALFILLASLRLGRSRDVGEATEEGTPSDVADVPDGDFKVVGYLPEYRVGAVDWNATCAGVTHVLFFSVEPTSDGALGALDRFPDAETLRRARDACDAYGTKLMVSVGGAGRSKHFAAATASDATRRKLARAIAAFCDAHSLQGVDINWEYPKDETQWLSLFKLARATRRAFERNADSTKTEKKIFLAFHPDGVSERFLRNPMAQKHVDLMHCMAYDNARDAEGHSTLAYAERAVANALETYTLEPKRVSLGIPFYGRGVKTRSVADAKGFSDIFVDMDTSRAFALDDIAALDVFDSYAFNSPATVRAKTALAINRGLGGVTVWELGQDANGATSLLGAVGSEAWPGGRARVAAKTAAREEL